MKKTHGKKEILLYGRHPVTLALANPRREIIEVLMTRDTDIDIPSGVNVRYVDKQTLNALVGKDAVHQGVVAKVGSMATYDIATLLNDIQDKDQAMVVILDQVTDPHNIGAIMRSAIAFYASAVIVPSDGAPDETGTLAKSASGATELIPLIRVNNLVRAMEQLKKADFWCIGMDGEADKEISQHALPKRCAIVMGAEGSGMRRLTEESCDYITHLPMNPAIESLNVSNACAVAMYEWVRQRMGK